MFENYPVSEALEKGSPAQLQFGAVGNHEQTNYPLTLSVFVAERLSFDYSYALQHFSASSEHRAVGRRVPAASAVGHAGNARQCLGEMSLLSDGQRAADRELESRRRSSGAAVNVHQLIEAQARRTPDAVALLCGDRQLSYGQFNQRANQLAHKLIELGIGPDVRVGIAVERGLDMIVGLLAVLKAGGAYVPLDPEYPQDRLHYMMQDSGIQLADPGAVARNVCAHGVAVPHLCLDQDHEWLAGADRGNPVQRSNPENLAYVMYTSGSTGRPKGVSITPTP
nr:AMP-binding protein [Pseudomonas chlororaphis]